ncbi:hypothetical protein D9Q98_007055 [Chlorella vulgaris]|uniref:Cytochrome P450 n=1 Tax=Chlorella vulgaris TaxID=3077 RepID=A0A9D4TJC0_CHLVU|nr:hypothetical protein D9Q98_007055 [Chlorella vulgaris]
MVALVVVVLLLAMAAAVFVATQRGTGSGAAIPNPKPFSDLVFEVTLTGGFPNMVKLHAAHGPVFWWRLLGRRMLMVGSYEAAKQLLMGEGTLVRADYPPSVKQMLGPWGMVNIHGKSYTRIKRLAQAGFTPKAIRGYLPRIQAIAEEGVQRWAAEGDILAYPEMKWYTFRVAVELFLGVGTGWTGPQDFPAVSATFATWLEGLFSFPVAIPGTAFARGLKARDELMRRIHASLELLEQRRAAKGSSDDAARGDAAAGGPAPASNGAEQPILMELLMASRDERGEGLTRDQLADTVLTLLFAGHDTSSTTLVRIFQHLHAHPEAVTRLRQEQAEVVVKHGTAITEAALADMQYADGALREAMRVTPIIAGFPRIALKDFELCGYTIPAGTRLQCSLQHTLHTDSRWQAEDDPLAFKPERWLGQRDGAWIPFGGGPRLCLGWLMAMVEMKVLLAAIFRGHVLTLQEPNEPWMLFPLARPKHGMPARITEAEAAA